MTGNKVIDPRQIKALALDLDGTILGLDNRISGRTQRAIRACKTRGIKLILCTGRSPESAEDYRAALEAEGPQVYFNGAVVADMPGGRAPAVVLLDKAVADFCVDLARKLGIYFQAYLPTLDDTSGNLLMAEHWGAEAEMYWDHTGTRAHIGDLKEALAHPGRRGCIKGMFIADPPVLDTIRPYLTERFGSLASITRTHDKFLELMSPGVSKGRGLITALNRRGLNAAEVIAFGDEENDLPLFQAAGFSAAPANAREQVRAAADFLTPPHFEDGVAAFLEDRLLNERNNE
jgi:Cof subfamily protein (haloacid dehalogenase superfamily)